MKLFAALGLLVGAYLYMLLQTTNVVLGQTQQLSAAYQHVANNADSDYALGE